MNELEMMKKRRSIRRFIDRTIEGTTLDAMKEIVAECNLEGGLNIQICVNEPMAFRGFFASYGIFKNVNHYIALVGEKSDALEEKLGYYGEKIVLKAVELGLGTCWVGATYKKGKCCANVLPGQKLVLVIAFGYYDKEPKFRNKKQISDLGQWEDPMPEWFRKGIEAARLAPTALNQQKFRFAQQGDVVKASCGKGSYTKVDLGIAKYHFELGAGKDNFIWIE